MYSLTLTADEQRAFDWVGDRYNTGKVADLLMGCIPEDRERSDEGDITFTIPEHLDRQIRDLADDLNFSWAWFGPPLVNKLNELSWSIV
jgi:hypothetical protein